MYLAISTTHFPATDLGFLLHKNPDSFLSKQSNQATLNCFFSEASAHRCTACLVMEISPLHSYQNKQASDSRRSQSKNQNHFVNDRPYVASSLMSVAISEIFGTALNGRSKERPELARSHIPLEAEISVVHCEEGESYIRKLFEPLGYELEIENLPLDEQFPEWGLSPYFNLKIKATKTLSQLLRQIYILIPVLDNSKHYWIDFSEQDKLLRMGEGWLATHPLVDEITRRALKNISSMSREALTRLEIESPQEKIIKMSPEETFEKSIKLSDQRFLKVAEVLAKYEVKTVVDLGCGEGKFIRTLLPAKGIEKILGLEVGIRELDHAGKMLQKNLNNTLNKKSNKKATLIHGSLTYLDDRTKGFDACVLIEVIEHIDLVRLESVKHNIFSFIASPLIIITTPNRDYNAKFIKNGLRHPDHRFEWSRLEFQNWCSQVCQKFGYKFEVSFIGDEDPDLGGPTQMGVFTK
jgi:3' terminal RNA ribose 2'-O-methyltransferase Hen1